MSMIVIMHGTQINMYGSDAGSLFRAPDILNFGKKKQALTDDLT